MGGDEGVWPIAGAAAPKVKPPANAAPLLRNSLRAGRFEPIGLSFSDEPAWESLPRRPEVYVSLGVRSITVRSVDRSLTFRNTGERSIAGRTTMACPSFGRRAGPRAPTSPRPPNPARTA